MILGRATDVRPEESMSAIRRGVKSDSRMNKLEDEAGILECDLGNLPKVSNARRHGPSWKVLTESTVSVRCKEFSSSRMLVEDEQVGAW